MKRKIAMAIAAVMAFTSILPATLAFGATVSTPIYGYGEGTYLPTEGSAGVGSTTTDTEVKITVNGKSVAFDNSERGVTIVSNTVTSGGAPYLDVPLDSNFTTETLNEQSFYIELTGAVFAYYASTGGTQGAIASMTFGSNEVTSTLAATGSNWNQSATAQRWANVLTGTSAGQAARSVDITSGGGAGTYTVTERAVGTPGSRLPYTLTLDEFNPSRARVTFVGTNPTAYSTGHTTVGANQAQTYAPVGGTVTTSGIYTYAAETWEKGDFFHIPLSFITTTAGTVGVRVLGSAGAHVSDTGVMTINTLGGRSTNTLVPGGNQTSVSSSNTIDLRPVTVYEVTKGSMRTGTFYLDAPEGYYFHRTLPTIKTSGLFTAVSTPLTQYTSGSPAWSVATVVGINAWFTNGANYYGMASTEAYTRLIVQYKGLDSSLSEANAAFNIAGLKLVPINEHIYGTDLSLTISAANKNDSYYQVWGISSYEGGMTYTGISTSGSNFFPVAFVDSNVTTQTFVVAKLGAQTEYGITYTPPVTVPALDPGYRALKAGTVKFAEKKGNSWWAYRNTTFTLADADGNPLSDVKFTSAYIDTSTNFTTPWVLANGHYMNTHSTLGFTGGNANNAAPTNGVFFPADNAFRLVGLAQTSANTNSAKLASFNITPYISVAVDFTGDVYLKVESDDYRFMDPGYVDNNGLVKIATVAAVVSVTGKTTDVQIGSQKIDVTDVDIVELKAGAIKRPTSNANLILSVRQFTNTPVAGMMIVPLAKAPTVTGTSPVQLDSYNVSGSTIAMTVKKAGSTVSTVSLKGVQVSVDRTVPYGTYDLALRGGSLSDNYDSTGTGRSDGQTTYDGFTNAGVKLASFVNVKTESSNNAKNNVVKVFNDGSANVVINGVESTMEAATENIDGSLYVPVRFIAYAMGAVESDIVWSEVTRTVSVKLNGEKITWTQDSPIYTLSNGAKEGMHNNAVATILHDRLYIPFRGFADAFNIPVDWDADAQAATYNPTASYAVQ